MKRRFPSSSERGRTRNRRGSALIEFSLTLPFLMVIVMGIFKFGIVLNHYLTLTEAVAAGGRYLAVSAGVVTDPCASTVSVVQGMAPTLSGLTFSISINGGTPYTTTCSGITLPQNGSAQLTVNYPTCDMNIMGVKYQNGCSLTSQVTEIIQ